MTITLRRLLAVACLAVVTALASATTASAGFGFLTGINMHGGGATGDLLQLDSPTDIARAATGEFFVADSQNHRILKLSSAGQFILEWGYKGTADGAFNYPNGVAVSPTTGDVWVADLSNHRLQRFDQNGNFLGKVGGTASGSGNGQFNQAGDVAVSPTGIVYATDLTNNRVQYFAADGTYQGQFGSSGTLDGQFNRPMGVDVADSGDVYVVDRFNYRVQYFTAGSHTFAGKWGCNCTGDGNFVAPARVFVDRSVTPNQVYVSNDYFDHRIQRFTLAGEFISKWGPEASLTPGSALGDMYAPTGLYVDAAHKAYVVENANQRIQVFSGANTATPTAVEAWGTRGNGPGQLSQPVAVVAAPDGSVYVADDDNDRVQHLSPTGLVLDQWGSPGSGDGQFEQMGGIALGPTGDVYVLTYANAAGDADTARVQRFDASGTFLSSWNLAAPGDPLSLAYDLDIDAAGNVFVSDGGNWRIVKFDGDGTPITMWGQIGTGDDNADFQYPAGLAVNAAGTEVYVADQTSHRIKKFDGSGGFLAQSAPHSWSGSSVDGKFSYPLDVAIEPASGDIFVADSYNDRIQRLTSTFGFVSKFGVRGRGEGAFQYPQSLSFDPNGNLYVSDRDNDRVQRFGGAPVVTISSPAAGWSTTADAVTLTYALSDPAAECDLASGSSVALVPGANSITVTCNNAQGSGSATVNVTRTVPPTPPPTAPAAAASLKLASKLKLAKTLRLKAICPAGCTITAKLAIGGKKQRLKKVVLTAGTSTRSVTLRLSAKQVAAARKALKVKRRVTLDVSLSAPGAAKTVTARAKLRR